MSTSLREAASRAARQNEIPASDPPAPTAGAATETDVQALRHVVDTDPMADYELGDDDPDQVPVHIAWLRVRRDVKKIEKRQKFKGGGDDGGGGNYQFRGVDAVLNAFGPVTLKHGVNVMPVKVNASYRDTTTSRNKKTRECTVLVSYEIIGPTGDKMPAQSAGESLDGGDKGTSKALAVALRTLLLHGGIVPTGDPDPDSVNIDRGDAESRSARDYVKEILDPRTSYHRMRQIHFEISNARMLDAQVPTEDGGNERLGDLCVREGKKRAPQQAANQPEQEGVPEPLAKHDHEDDFSPNCDACKAEQAAADRAMAGDS